MKIKNAKKYLAVALTAATLVTGVGFDSPTISYADTIEDSSSVNNEAVTGTDLFEKLVVSDGWQDDWAFDCKNVLYASNTPVKKVNKNFNLYTIMYLLYIYFVALAKISFIFFYFLLPY